MKTLRLLGAALLLAAACDKSNGTRVPPESFPVEGTPFDGTNAWIRLRGVNAAAFSAALVQVRSLRIEAAGAVVADLAVESQLDLARDHAWLLAHVEVPAGVDKLAVSLVLDDGGGAVKGGAGLAIDAPCATMRWEVPVELLRQNSHSVAHLDVERSLVHRGSGLLLLPQFSVHP